MTPFRTRRWTRWLAAALAASFLCAGAAPAARGGAPASAVPDDLLSRIDRFVAEQVRLAGWPGASLAVVSGGQTVLARGYGVTDWVRKEQVTPDTVFQVGSVTKSFTALAILQLQAQGRVDLDRPVRDYLPWFQVADPASDRITVRHLLTQTSGLPRSSHAVIFAQPPQTRRSLQAAVGALRTVKLHHPPGAQFEYANMNFSALGAIVEAASDMDYAAYVKQQILAPLGMEHSTFDAAQAAVWPHARLHGTQFGFFTEIPYTSWNGEPWAAPAAQLLSTASDLARYSSFELGASGAAILSDGAREGAWQGGAPTGWNASAYNMGWFHEMQYGTRLVWHNGETEGASSAVMLMPEQQLGVALLAGARSTLPQAITQQIAAMLLGHEASSPASGVESYRLFGRALLGAVVLSATLLLWLGLTLRRGRTPKAPGSRRRAIAISATLTGATALAASLPFWVSPLLPGPFGIYGYPADLLIGVGSLVLSLGLWAVYWMSHAK